MNLSAVAVSVQCVSHIAFSSTMILLYGIEGQVEFIETSLDLILLVICQDTSECVHLFSCANPSHVKPQSSAMSSVCSSPKLLLVDSRSYVRVLNEPLLHVRAKRPVITRIHLWSPIWSTANCLTRRTVRAPRP